MFTCFKTNSCLLFQAKLFRDKLIAQFPGSLMGGRGEGVIGSVPVGHHKKIYYTT